MAGTSRTANAVAVSSVKCVGLPVALMMYKKYILNIRTFTGKGRELADILKRNVNIRCLHKTKWKVERARKFMRAIKSYTLEKRVQEMA